jgi:hypothetical protein
VPTMIVMLAPSSLFECCAWEVWLCASRFARERGWHPASFFTSPWVLFQLRVCMLSLPRGSCWGSTLHFFLGG